MALTLNNSAKTVDKTQSIYSPGEWVEIWYGLRDAPEYYHLIGQVTDRKLQIKGQYVQVVRIEVLFVHGGQCDLRIKGQLPIMGNQRVKRIPKPTFKK